MKVLNFQLKFLSDIVLPATSNTEGKIEDLDFIAGSNFLGMVAKEYDEFSDTFAVFHSGDVRFGDATSIYNNQATYKMPLSFFHEKLDDDDKIVIYNHHLITDFTKFKQLKQRRKGFITQNLHEVKIKHNYAQKSAYDKKHRRSKDSSMYGYNAMPKGSIWQFSVKYNENISQEDIERIKNNLVGKKRLGKSKSSQYGKVEIKEVSTTVENRVKEVASSELTLLYVKSRLALVDSEGNATYDLNYLVEGLDEKNIVWEKSQLRTSSYARYDRTMQTKSYERMVINSGSVIVLKDVDSALIEKIKKGVGVYLNEGFGEILVNPAFLFIKKSEFTKKNIDIKEKPLAITHPSVKFLQNRQEQKRKQLDMANSVQNFIKKHKSLYQNIKNSQWGTIRSICTSGSRDFKQDIEAYITSGKVTWREEQIKTLLKAINNGIAFTKLLTIQMAKESRDEN